MRSVLALLFVAALSSAPAQDTWPRFRGPQGSGVATSGTLPDTWTEADYAWQVELPGKGHSSPVAWNDLVVALSAREGKLFVCGYSSASGDELWRREYECPAPELHLSNSTAVTTPAIDAEHVYVTYATADALHVVALSHTGEEVWQRELPAFAGNHGYGASPIVEGGMVCIVNDTADEGLLVGVNAATGDEEWRIERPLSKETYSTPCTFTTSDGQTLIVCESMSEGLQAVDPRDGDIVWKLGDIFPERTVSSPVVAGDLIVCTCGSGNGGRVLVAASFDETSAKVAYTLPRNVPYVPTVVAKDDLLFLWHDQGIVTCIERDGGKLLWRERIGGRYFGSPIVVGDKLVAQSIEGEAVVLAAVREYKLLGRTDLGEASQATPAVAGGKLLLRTESQLFCLPLE